MIQEYKELQELHKCSGIESLPPTLMLLNWTCIIILIAELRKLQIIKPCIISYNSYR